VTAGQQGFRASVERLRRHDDVLARAIQRTHDEALSEEEQRALAAIERLRVNLAESTREVTGFDYGAGSPSESRSRDVARQGVWSTFAVGHDLTDRMSRRDPWTHLLFNLVRLKEPNRCLELGTCIGLSAAYLCAGLEMNGRGLLVTLEGNEQLVPLAEKHLKKLGLSRFRIIAGRFEDTLEDVLCDFGPFDFVFNDGHHDGTAMLDYFLTTLPFLSPDAVLLFDDIRQYASMRDGWQTIAGHEQVRIAVDFGPLGLCRLGNPEQPRCSVSIRLT